MFMFVSNQTFNESLGLGETSVFAEAAGVFDTAVPQTLLAAIAMVERKKKININLISYYTMN